MKQFKLRRTIKEVLDSPLTEHLLTLKRRMERLQAQYPDDDFEILDEHDQPVQMMDVLGAELASPANKAARKKASQKVEYEATMRAKVRRL